MKKLPLLLFIFKFLTFTFASFDSKTDYIVYNNDEIPFKYRKNIIKVNGGEITFRMPSEFRGRLIFKSTNSFKVGYYRDETCKIFDGGPFYEGGTDHPFEISYGSFEANPECTWRMYWYNFYDGLTYKTSALVTSANFDGNDEYVKGFNGPTNEINPITFAYDPGRNLTFCGGKWSGTDIFYGVYPSAPCISLGNIYNSTHRIYNIIIRKLEPKCKHEITVSEGMFLIFPKSEHPNTLKGHEPFDIPKWPPGNQIYVPLQFEGIIVAAISFATVPLIGILLGSGVIILTFFIKIPYFRTNTAVERSEEKMKYFNERNKKKWQKYKETRKDFREVLAKSDDSKPSQPHGYEYEDEPIKMRVDWKNILDSDKKELDRIREYYQNRQKSLPLWLSKDVLNKDFEYPPPIDVKIQKKITTKAPLFTSIVPKAVIKVEEEEVSATKELLSTTATKNASVIKDISKTSTKVTASKKDPDVSKKMDTKETQKTEPMFETEAEIAAKKAQQTDATQGTVEHTVATQEENPEDAMNI